MAKSTIVGNQRGAVLAEFVVALVPLLTTFFCLVQLGKLYAANLALKHAAMCAARAATVIAKPPTMNPGATGDPNEIELAAYAALGNFYTNGGFHDVTVKVTLPSGDPHGVVTVDVTATYDCDVPLGGRITCFAGGGTKTKTESASLPLQGAQYAEEKQ
ncbi:MAG: hypothetical protein HOO96_26080 [Polyangiaceae bacterium]|nr:hypothetical protein [Polyangiaceae bacterium]